MAVKRIFSGIQPTGQLHLGNYCGAVRNWVQMQDTGLQFGGGSQVLLSIVDLHAMTSPYRPKALRSGVMEMTASLLACGLKPDRGQCTLFIQSEVREHSELAWILSCLAPLGWLQRMTQFKDKESARSRVAKAVGKAKNAEDASFAAGPVAGAPLGLLSYPVLQAADILLYRSTHVPVGEDQAQHLELARDIAAAFTSSFGQPGSAPLFPAPQTMLMATGARIMSLRDGTKKMSKSDPVDDSRINLRDSADTVAAKVRAARTDSAAGFTFDPATRPDKSNLLAIFSVLSGESIDAVSARFAGATATSFKADLTDLLVATVVPIGKDIEARLADPGHLDHMLQAGAERARVIAQATMLEVRLATGYR